MSVPIDLAEYRKRFATELELQFPDEPLPRQFERLCEKLDDAG